MPAEQATINVRISAPLKDRGDKVLREHGLSTSEAIRLLWSTLANDRRLPAFLSEAIERRKKDACAGKRSALDKLVGITSKGSELSDADIEALHVRALIRDYEAIS